MTYAVLGAGGFIGSAMTRQLLELGHEVLAIASRVPSNPERREVWESASQTGLLDLGTDKLDFLGCKYVLNFAADMGGVGYFSDAQVGPYIANSRITFNVLESAAAQGIDRLFMSSSACAYPIESQMIEGMAPKLKECQLEQGTPDQMYGREKLMQIALSRNVEIDTRVGILHTIYGDPDTSKGSRIKFPTAIASKAVAAINSGELEIWGNGKQLRSYLWIDDAIDKILQFFNYPENIGPVNIGMEGAITVKDVADICCQSIGITPEYQYNMDAPSGVLARDCDNSKFETYFEKKEPMSYVKGFSQLTQRLRMKPVERQSR